MSNFSKKIKEGLEDIVAYQDRKLDLRTTQIEMPMPPTEYKALEIKRIRNEARYSQTIFALVLNVSVKTVRSWEGGQRNPSHTALRLLEIIDKGIYRPAIEKKQSGAFHAVKASNQVSYALKKISPAESKASTSLS